INKTEGLECVVTAVKLAARADCDERLREERLAHSPALLARSHLTCPYVNQFLGPPPSVCTSDSTHAPAQRQPISSDRSRSRRRPVRRIRPPTAPAGATC